MQKIYKITQPFPEDVSDLLFQTALGMPDHNQLKRHDNTKAYLDV